MRLEQEGRLASAVDLYWIPLGVGAYVARLSGKLYEAANGMSDEFSSATGSNRNEGGKR